MKRIWHFIVKVWKNLTGSGSVPTQRGIMGRGQIINPKYTPTTQVIEPIPLEFTDDGLRTVLRPHPIINVKPPRQYVAEEA
jgi:hypothetical protein